MKLSELKPVYVFVGEEAVLLEESLKKLKKMLGENALMNFNSYNGEDKLNLDDFCEVCNTLPFLAEKRLVILRHFNKLKKDQQKRVLDYATDPLDSTILVLTVESGAALKKGLDGVLKPLSGKAVLKRFDPLKGHNLIDWIQRRAKLFGKEIEKDAAFRLSDVTGTNTWFINSELEKLSIYVGRNKSITIKDVDALVMPTQEASIFDFTDALFGRQKDVLKRLREMELSGAEALPLLAMLQNQTIQHYQVICGPSDKPAGVHPFVAKKMAARKRLWSPAQLRHLLADLRSIERGMKTGRTMEPFIALADAVARVM